MKFIFSFLILFFISFSQINSQPTISLSNIISQPSSNVTVPLRMKSFLNVGAISLKISVSPSVVNFIGLTSNYNNLSISSSYQNGVVTISWFDFSTINPLNISDSILTVLNFTFNGGSTSLNFITNLCEIADINGQPIQNILYINGSISQFNQLNSPVLYSPANNATTTNTVEFKWSKVLSAQEYNLVISNNSGFVVTVFDQWFFSDTSYTLQLATNTQYFWKVRARNSLSTSDFSSVYSFTTSVSSNNDSEDILPTEFDFSIYPNPFNPSTTIQFNLNQQASPILNVLNSIGEIIYSETLNYLSPGIHNYKLDAKNLASGIYFVKVSVLEKIKVKKAVKLN